MNSFFLVFFFQFSKMQKTTTNKKPLTHSNCLQSKQTKSSNLAFLFFCFKNKQMSYMHIIYSIKKLQISAIILYIEYLSPLDFTQILVL